MSDDANLSRLRELALRGKNYSETNEYDYVGQTVELSISPLVDDQLIPFAAALEAKFGMEVEDASERIDESRDEDGDIDPAKMDEDFVRLMADAAVKGINEDEADVTGESEEDLREIFGISDTEEDIGLIGGKTLEIAQDVIDLSSDDEAAESFRR